MLAGRLLLAMLLAGWLLPSYAQTSSGAAGERQKSAPASLDKAAADTNRENGLGRPYVINLLQDQRAIWTSPKHLRLKDLNWIVPVGAASATLLYNDPEITKRLATHPNLMRQSKTFSDYGAFAMVGAAGGMYLLGKARSNDHARETGLLASEAVLDGLLVNEVLKVSSQRERPFQGAGAGKFWSGGSSFPSSHAMVSWSVATVIAHEYPGPLTRVLAYGSAAAISAARVSAQQHFASDVVVGGTIGYLIGRQVYRAHHDTELSGAAISSDTDKGEPVASSSLGSPYVPLDSWVYAAFDKLAALGVVKTGFAGLRPWTRSECLRLLTEIEEQQPDSELPASAARIVSELRREFEAESGRVAANKAVSAEIESVYTRYMSISGTPLTDDYHFASTVVNDYGRPFGEGNNFAGGVSARSVLGPVTLYFRGEYQGAPAGPMVPLAGSDAIVAADGLTSALPGQRPAANRLRVIEGYAAFMFRGVQISAGQQSLWWGPGAAGPMLFSNNAESIPMLRISRTEPFRLPGFLSFMGPLRTEFFFGKLEGHRNILQENGELPVPNGASGPYLHGIKLSFKPTPNLEFGFSRTVIMGGFGHPLTPRSLWRSLVSVGDRPDTRIRDDVGDRRAGFDFSYRVPGLRKWLVLYCDSMADDNPLSWADPSRAAWNPGIYLPQIPLLPNLELRAEAVTTDSPGFEFPGVNYQNVIYRSGYTNHGRLLGSWAGRQSKALQLSGRYSFSARNSIELAYRKQKVSPKFLSGGAVDDVRVGGNWQVRRDVTVNGWTQYERWQFPLLATAPRSNVAVAMQVTFRPRWGLR